MYHGHGSYEATTRIDLTFLTCSGGAPHPQAAASTVSFNAAQRLVVLAPGDEDEGEEASGAWDLWTCGDFVAFTIEHYQDEYSYFELWIYHWKTGEEIIVCIHNVHLMMLPDTALSLQNLYAVEARSECLMNVTMQDPENILLVDSHRNVVAALNVYQGPRDRTKVSDALEHHASILLALPPWNTSKRRYYSSVKCTPRHPRTMKDVTLSSLHSNSVILISSTLTGSRDSGCSYCETHSYDLLIPSRAITSRMTDASLTGST